MALAAPDMGPQELTTCLWALCRLRYRPPEPWLEALAARGAALLPHAWQQQQQQQEEDGSSSSSRGRAAATADAAVQLLQQQQRNDSAEAEVRRRRQQLLRQIQQLEQQRRHLQRPQQGQPYSTQLQRQQHQQQQLHQQQQSLLQLRGDLELLQQRLQSGRVQQQGSGQPPCNPAEQPGDKGQQQQHLQERWLGAGDVRVVLASLQQLQFSLQE